MATGISPDVLVEHDDWMLHALADAVGAQKWRDNEELLAMIAELLHALLVVTIKVHSKKGAQMPKPLRITRPGQPEPEEPSVSIGQMARRMARGR